MQAWQSIQKTVNYIEEHYSEELSIQELSKIAGLSPFYFQRLFSKLVGRSINEYIKLRRLAKAAKFLKETRFSILTIALECGFASHEVFSKSFKQIYQITPSYYRNNELTIDYFLKPDLSLRQVVIEEGIPLITADMVLEIRRDQMEQSQLFVGFSKEGSTEELNEPKVNPFVELWNRLGKEESILKQQANIGIGADILLPSTTKGKFEFMVVVESDRKISGYQSWIMPEGDYIVCSYEAENFELLVTDALYKASQYLFETWLVEQRISVEPFIVQKYYNPEQENSYIEVWVKIKEDEVDVE